MVVFDGIVQIYFTQHNGMESIKYNRDIACPSVPQKLVMFQKNKKTDLVQASLILFHTRS